MSTATETPAPAAPISWQDSCERLVHLQWREQDLKDLDWFLVEMRADLQLWQLHRGSAGARVIWQDIETATARRASLAAWIEAERAVLLPWRIQYLKDRGP